MNATDLPDWLADPALRPLWEAAATRLERRRLEPGGRVRLTELDRATRHALGALLGRPIVADTVNVDLAEVDTLARSRSGVGGLRTVVETALGRRLRDRVAERSLTAAAREAPYAAARAWLDDHPETALEDWPERWLASLRRSGLLTRMAEPSVLVVQALELLAEQLSEPRQPWSKVDLAAHRTGDAHALDDDRPLGQLVLRGLAASSAVDPPVSAAERRALWEAYDISTDSVSSTCLTLRVRESGDPVHLTSWDLRRTPVSVPAGRTVLVCENPRVLEAFAERADLEGAVVCTSGEPNLVSLEVFRTLRSCGVRLLYHGDFDWPGLGIANRLIDSVGVEPWKMSAADYGAAVRPDGPPLQGSAVAARWDPDLGTSMQTHGVAVHEESVLESLLAAW